MSLSALRIQAQIFNFGVQNSLIYRWNFLHPRAGQFHPAARLGFPLERGLQPGKQAFAGYTFTSMVAYFITLILVDTLVLAVDDEFQMSEDIRDGRINTLLLKPIDYRLYRFHLFTLPRESSTPLSPSIPLGIAMIWLGYYLHWNTVAGESARRRCSRLSAPRVMQFMFTFTIGLLAFWILDIGSVAFILYSDRISPRWPHLSRRRLSHRGFKSFACTFPFAYETWFPAAILIDHVHGAGFMAPASSGNGRGSDFSTSSAAFSGNAACISTPPWVGEFGGLPSKP